KAKLVQCLRNVSEVAWQWRQDLRTRSDVFTVEGQGQVPHDRLTIEPPTLLAPPSVEMFQSSPPPAGSEPALGAPPPNVPLVTASAPSAPAFDAPAFDVPASEWPAAAHREQAPAAVEPLGFGATEGGLDDDLEPPWAKRSVLRRWFSASAQREPSIPPVGSPSRPPARPSSPPRSSSPPRKGPLAFPTLSDAVYATADIDPDSGPPEASSREAPAHRRSSGFSWWSASLGVVAIACIGVLVATFRGAQPEAVVAGPVAAIERSAGPAHAVAAPPLAREALDGLLADAHGYGGIESPELADLLDGEAAQLVDAGGACAPGATGCELIRTAALSAAPAASSPRPGLAERGSWLEGLELPGIGIKDDARVRQVFEFHTRNSVGREAFQELLFRCSGYRDMVRTALDRYGMPSELLALPMATSGCLSDGESDDGGRGLWQLTPPAAKAYHLRFEPRVVDERIDPAKSTEAGVRLLEDLHRKLGSWELALAAYRLGPLALIARVRDAGEDASYWALDDAGALPPAAAQYVPKVQAFALILANLSKFRFEPVRLAAPEVTAPLEVPPGTRLGLVARAAASSTTHIRELNPDVLGDRVPDWPGERFVLRVPKDAGDRAREALPVLIASADHSDECVPHAFDWGRQRFTQAMASRCEQTSNR
ncbi:MAG TPA: transglycosylase SLT domain-containing protein, partial [Polyangiaceae bacterium]|nr:transglycosylase SLT domain-containing protein [Polyangiaceae bacterium]